MPRKFPRRRSTHLEAITEPSAASPRCRTSRDLISLAPCAKSHAHGGLCPRSVAEHRAGRSPGRSARRRRVHEGRVGLFDADRQYRDGPAHGFNTGARWRATSRTCAATRSRARTRSPTSRTSSPGDNRRRADVEHERRLRALGHRVGRVPVRRPHLDGPEGQEGRDLRPRRPVATATFCRDGRASCFEAWAPPWSAPSRRTGYEHNDSQSIAGAGSCVREDNQPDMSEDRVKAWVSQIKGEGMLL